jgi:predicted TIM-barrel fold metal-dependent hydrolase
MDIVDSQVHMGPGGAAEMAAAMNALGVSSVLIDEWWMGTAGDPGYHLPGGVFRTTSPSAELAAWTYRDFDPIFAAAAECGLPIFVQISGAAHLLERYARNFPGVKMIICHCGMPPGRTLVPIIARMEGLPDSAEYWAKAAAEPAAEAFDKVLRAADLPNVALKWAHAPGMFDAAGYPNEGTRPYLRKALDAFGAERVMWASDISANQTGESWAELLFAIRDNPDLREREKEYVLGRTAREWLNWPAA